MTLTAIVGPGGARRALLAASLAVAVVGCATLNPGQDAPDFGASMAIARAHLEAGQADAAVVALGTAATLDRASKEPWLEMARIRESQGRHVDALAAAEQVLRRDPTDAAAHEITIASGLEVARRTLQRLLATEQPPDADQLATAQAIGTLMTQVFGPEFLVSDELRIQLAREAVARYKARRIEKLPEARQEAPKGDPLDLLGGD